jgi:hypothetical protein
MSPDKRFRKTLNQFLHEAARITNKNWILEKQRGWPSKNAGLKKTRCNSLGRYVCCTLDVRTFPPPPLPFSLFNPPGGSHFETPPQKAVTRPYGQFQHGDGTTSS